MIVLSLWRGLLDVRELPAVVVARVEVATGWTLAAMRGYGRAPERVTAFQWLMHDLVKEARMTVSAVGRLLERHPTTIMSGVAAHEKRQARG